MAAEGGQPCCLCIVSWQRWCVTWRGKKKKKKGVLEGVSGEWGLLKNLRQECVYLTRPAPTHPWPPSQFPGWGPDLGDVSPLSQGFCRSHYHLTPWGVSKRMELKFGSPLNKQSTAFPTNQSMRKNMSSEDICLWLIDVNFTHLWFFCPSSIGF